MQRSAGYAIFETKEANPRPALIILLAHEIRHTSTKYIYFIVKTYVFKKNTSFVCVQN